MNTSRLLYEARDFPVLQNRLYCDVSEARDCPKGDLVIIEDQQSGLVYNAAFQLELLDYDADYNNEQATSPSFRRHLEEVAVMIDSMLGRENLVEIGCGKAFFMEMLIERGCDITGFDPAYEGDNHRVKKEYFLGDSGLEANGLILRHVLEHIENPVEFLESLSRANNGKGKIYIEVPCFEWICQHRAWFDMFYEHVNYFRQSDFKRMFGKIDACGSFFGGQYLYVIAEIGSIKRPEFDSKDPVEFPDDFARSILVPEGQDITEKPVCVWGAGSKGVIFSLLRERAGYPVSMVIDINPAKQGKYLPGTGLRVQSPEEAMKKLFPGSTIYVMNSNYMEEIKEMSNNLYQYVGVDQ